jgi:predicted transcriptional regulator of viral defense system
MKKRIGRLEAQLLAYAQMRKRRILVTGELTGALGINPKQERELLSRMARAGLIAAVRRGLYLVPDRLPLGGEWSPDAVLALNTLIGDRQGRYQICGPNAFNRYGFDEQIPIRLYAYNNRISGNRTVGSTSLTLIKVADKRLGGTEEVKSANNQCAIYSSRARSLVDAVYDWSRFNSLPRGYTWIREELKSGRIRPAKLLSLTIQFGDKGTIRRMGALLERSGVSEYLLKKLERTLTPTRGFIPLVPTRPKRGIVDNRWGVIINDSV